MAAFKLPSQDVQCHAIKHELGITMVTSWNSHHKSLVYTQAFLLNLSSTSCRWHLHRWLRSLSLLLLLLLLRTTCHGLFSKFLRSLPLHEISPNAPQISRGLLNQFTALRAFLQGLQQGCNLSIVVEMRTSSAMSKVGNSA